MVMSDKTDGRQKNHLWLRLNGLPRQMELDLGLELAAGGPWLCVKPPPP
jgi:hypothetical protein